MSIYFFGAKYLASIAELVERDACDRGLTAVDVVDLLFVG
jgi:hypothetical protein